MDRQNFYNGDSGDETRFSLSFEGSVVDHVSELLRSLIDPTRPAFEDWPEAAG